MRSITRLAPAIALALVVTLAGPVGAQAAGRVTRDSSPTTYAVGKRSEVFVDSSRPTDPNGTYPGAPSRTLPVLVLYPATGTPGGEPREGARAARHGGPFPLVVFSHGFTAHGPDYDVVLLRRIAAHGYVVAAPTFPLSSGGAPGGPRLLDYVNQPGDVSFVITKMLRLDRRDGTLHGVIDREEIGAIGHSLGAITTLGVTYNSCCADRRIKAAVPISGLELPFHDKAWSWPAVPLLLIHGDHDETVPYAGSTLAYAHAKPPKYLLTLLDAPHTPFRVPYQESIVRVVNAFLDGYLKHDRSARHRLPQDANVPGVASLQSRTHAED